MPTLKDMQTPGYNGTPCVLTACDTPCRIGARLANGRVISVRLNCIDDTDITETCPVCLDPLFKPITKTLVCNHALHWYCLDSWQRTANFDPEAAGARCPKCRAYIGLSLKEIGVQTLAQDAWEIVIQALGAIHQNVARLDGHPEPSFDEEMLAVLEQLKRAMEQIPDCLEKLDTLRRRFLSNQSDENASILYDALQRTLIIHCFPRGAEHKVNPKYATAINLWMRTLSQDSD